MNTAESLKQLVTQLGIDNTDLIKWELLTLALIHPSISREQNHQQLEFLGDAVVRLAATEILLEKYPDSTIGDLARCRAIMVSDRTLAEIAQTYELEKYISISKQASQEPAGEISRLADTLEAILGALYLSTHNLDLIRPWLDPQLQKKILEILEDPARQNYKDALQEWTQANYKDLPRYRLQENVDQAERFLAEVWLKDQQLGVGKGRTKKAAEQAAAKAAFLRFRDNSADF